MEDEDLLTDITYEALVLALRKEKNKTQIMGRMKIEYEVDAIEELTETKGMEFLEILDANAAYYLRKKHAQIRIEAEKVRRNQMILEYLGKHCERYLLLDKGPNVYLIMKECKVKAYTINEKPIFQPYEQTKEQTFLALYIVETEYPEDTKMIGDIRKKGCQVIKINNCNDIERKLEEL